MVHPVHQLAVRHVASDQRDRPRVSFNEEHVFGAPTQRFDADCPGAGATVEYPGPLDAGAHDVEQGLA